VSSASVLPRIAAIEATWASLAIPIAPNPHSDSRSTRRLSGNPLESRRNPGSLRLDPRDLRRAIQTLRLATHSQRGCRHPLGVDPHSRGRSPRPSSLPATVLLLRARTGRGTAPGDVESS
jgi:hypothetical protein